MKKFILIALLFTLSCQKKDSKEQHILSKNQVIEVMLELTVLEEKIIAMKLPKDSAEHYYDYFREQVFLEKGVNRAEFDSCYSYYLINDLEGFQEIQLAMIDSLTKYKSTLKVSK